MLYTSKKLTIIAIIALMLTACGGGSKSPNTSVTPSTPSTPSTGGGNNTPVWQLNDFPDEATFKDLCAAPRVGFDVTTNEAFPDKSGTAMDEKMWLRSWSNNTYLWYNEINDVDPRNFTVANYFDRLKTNQRTQSGAEKDNFHFSQSTAEYNERAFGGVVSGYGINWAFIRTSPPRKLIITYVEDNSPAANAGLVRGLELTHIDEIDFIDTNSQGNINTINDALFPSALNQIHQFEFINPETNTSVSASLSSAEINQSYVQNAQVINSSAGQIGYVQFNAFNRIAQTELVNALQSFSNANIDELVIDLRYNSGGLLAMASQLAYMVAGDSQTANLDFETSQFNDKHPNVDPVTQQPLTPTPFYTKEIDWENGVFSNVDLPSVSLPRVFVLTTEDTCSASEALINGLRGINVDVVQIGNTTCGKPYGFYPQDNCGTTYFTIQFQGVNDKGFGDYADGFSPSNNPQFDDQLPGCTINDDFSNQLGDTNEALFAAAITYAETGSCPVQTQTASTIKSHVTHNEDGLAIKTSHTILDSIINENKIYIPLKQPQK